jgi:hypothetical protein
MSGMSPFSGSRPPPSLAWGWAASATAAADAAAHIYSQTRYIRVIGAVLWSGRSVCHREYKPDALVTLGSHSRPRWSAAATAAGTGGQRRPCARLPLHTHALPPPPHTHKQSLTTNFLSAATSSQKLGVSDSRVSDAGSSRMARTSDAAAHTQQTKKGDGQLQILRSHTQQITMRDRTHTIPSATQY